MAIWATPPYADDELFDPASPHNRDDCLVGFRALRKRVVSQLGGVCHTADVAASMGLAPDVVVFLEIPERPVAELLEPWPRARPWVILLESEVVTPRNWERGRHAEFDVLFTWADELVDGDRYRKINYANPWPATMPDRGAERSGFCAMIIGNKSSDHPLELYSARRDLIRWYQRHHPAAFDLYGVGWDRPAPDETIRLLIAALADRARLPYTSFPSWRGTVASKWATLKNYRFAIAFENSRGIPGYITEKIFDCMFAGAVPVYWGAPDVSDHIPASCFVDRRRFRDWAALHHHLAAMPEEAYAAHRAAIDSFLGSDAAHPFTADYFASQICSAVEERLSATTAW